jgi:hypothetical protein
MVSHTFLCNAFGICRASAPLAMLSPRQPERLAYNSDYV